MRIVEMLAHSVHEVEHLQALFEEIHPVMPKPVKMGRCCQWCTTCCFYIADCVRSVPVVGIVALSFTCLNSATIAMAGKHIHSSLENYGVAMPKQRERQLQQILAGLLCARTGGGRQFGVGRLSRQTWTYIHT